MHNVIISRKCTFSAENVSWGQHSLQCRTGGAIYHVGPHLFLNNTSFESNTCSTYGGAVQVDSVALLDGSWADDEELLVQNCSFKNNTSKGNGGAINYSGSNGQNTETMCLNGTQFDGNTAPSGGALYLDGVANVLVYQTIFERNVASSGLGGGIYTYGELLHNYSGTALDCVHVML